MIPRWKGWHRSWRLRRLEGRRGAGDRAGEFGLALHPAGWYPTCSVHGAMNCVKRAEPIAGTPYRTASLWRCLVEGCNIGAEWIG